MNIKFNSNELQSFCVKLADKKRLHLANIRKSDYYDTIISIQNNLGITNLRQLFYHIKHDINRIQKCKCGNNVNWNKSNNSYLNYCSLHCSTKFTQENRKSTNLLKYGCDNYAKSDQFRLKSKETFIKNYGVDNPSKSDEIQKKKLSTNLQKYGVNNYSQSHLPIATQQIINNKDEFLKVATGNTVAHVANELGLSPAGPIKIANKFRLTDIFIAATRSSYEEKMIELLKSIDVTYIQNSKSIINPLQLDFYIPKFNLAIEVGSMYFHCELSHNKTRTYHQSKWKMCNDKNITLFQYFDDDIIKKWNIIKSKIIHMCRINDSPIIGARKTLVNTDVSTIDERIFLEKFHLQGHNFSRNITYVAKYLGKIMAILSIKYKRNQADIIRYATDTSYRLPGLFSKMLKKFIIDISFTGDIISFSDNRHSNGNLYKSNGFVLKTVTPPGYSYTKNYLTRENRLAYQKHLLADKFNLDTDYVNSHTEWEIMQSQGYDRLWDAGQSKWILTV